MVRRGASVGPPPKFCGEGANLALSAHTNFDTLKKRLDTRRGLRSPALQADVNDPQALEGAMDRTVSRFGRVDICVVNAGVWPPHSLRLDEMPVERIG